MTAKTAPKITLWEFFQQLGKTFMLPVALLSFCGIMLGIGSSLSSHDVLTLLPWLDMPLLQAIFIWMSKVGSFAFQLPAGHVLYRHPAGSGAREQRRRRLRRLRWLRGHEPGGQLLADREGYSAHHRRRDPEGQQYPEHYRYSVNRYRDPRGGDRRNYRLAAA